MKNLLELALEAHGGLTRWPQLKAISALTRETSARAAVGSFRALGGGWTP